MLKKLAIGWYDFVDYIHNQRDKRKFEKFISYCDGRGIWSIDHSRCGGRIRYHFRRED